MIPYIYVQAKNKFHKWIILRYPGTILTYTFKEYFIAPNKTYDLYRSIFLTGLLVTFPLLFDTIDISEEMASTLMIATLILLGTSILSYNFVI